MKSLTIPSTFVPSLAGAAITTILWLIASTPAQAETSTSTNQFQIAYFYPEDPKLKPFEDLVEKYRILEQAQNVLSFLRLPQPILLRFAQCNSENAWYDPHERTVTFCYELVRQIQNYAPKRVQKGVSREDAIIGSIVFSLLHEIGHAVIDQLEIPVLGRQEDAADMIAAHTLLKLPAPLPRRMVSGAAWMWGKEARSEEPDRGDLADVHSLSSQRFFNLLCLAYGSDPTTFSLVTDYLPSDRATGCKLEYKSMEFAIQKLFGGHVDRALLVELRQHYEAARGQAASGGTK